jgi:2-polyprenyl-3-methyl-5-hydroxy-6-metoxy-1,4-benzoquinol methylase
MKAHLVPERQRGVEILDDPQVDPELMKRSMRDVAKANTLFGGKRAALAEVMPALRAVGGRATLLDVGTGRGDIPRAVRDEAKRTGLDVQTIGMDYSLCLVSSNRDANDSVLRGDALCIPLRDRSVDVVMASQILHHFRGNEALTFVREMNRVARSRVVISDLRRSVVAAAGLWIGSFPLRFHPVSRHDGVVSVMRGFLPEELEDLVQEATGFRPDVTRRLGFRLTTSWKPR